MSLLSIYLERDMALIGSDTAGRPLGMKTPEQDLRISKLLPLPLSNSVLACRGTQCVFNFVWYALSLEDTGSFDALAAMLSDKVRIAVEIARADPNPPATDGNFALIGWSDEFQSMRCVVLELKGEVVTPNDSADGWDMFKAPNGADIVVNSPEAMFECAIHQVAEVREGYPDMAVGGDLLLATLRRKSLMIENLGDLG